MLTLEDFLNQPSGGQPEERKGNLQRKSLADFLPEEPIAQKKERGSLGQAWSALKEGAQDTAGAVGSTARTYAGDSEGVVRNAKEARERSSQSEAVRRTEFKQDLSARRKARGEDDSWSGAASDVFGAIGSNKEGAAQEMIAQLPNAAPSIAGGLAGAKLGTLVAPALGPLAPLGPIVGGALGMIFGATAVETGFKANEKAADGDFTPEDRSETIREGAVKGAVVGTMDAATLGASRYILGTAARASSNAAAKVLADAGVDATSRTAVKAALENPAIDAAVRKAATDAAEAAAKAANTLPKRGVRGAAVLGSEAFGEGSGEYFGELAATGEADKADAILEGVMGLGQSAIEIPASKIAFPNQRLRQAPIASATSEEEKKPQGSTTSQLLTQNAFADVMGDETLAQQQQVARAQLASALSQMDDTELRAATTHLAQGNEQLAQQLSEMARDPEVRSQWAAALSGGTQQYIDVAAAIRRDSGITLNDSVETPSAPRIARAVSEELDATGQLPMPPLNSAGFVPEPTPQLQAQLAAVADGRKTAVIMGVDDAQRVNLAGFSVGTAIDPSTGQEVLVVARDNGTVQNFVTRADEVGVQQAAGEILGYADPTQTTNPAPDAVAVQQLDESGQIIDEQIVTPESIGNVQQIEGAQTRVLPAQQALMERTQQTAAEMPSEDAPLRQMSPPEATNSPATDRWVADFNQQLGLDPASPQSIDPLSILQVQPTKKQPQLLKLAKAMKEAFGIDVMFVATPQGALMRRDGTRFNSFNGVASGNTLIMNVDAATPLNTFAHEAAHILQNQRPEIYAKLEMAVLSRLSPEKARKFYAGLDQALQSEGNNANVELEFRSEIVAEAIGEMAQDQKFWRDVFSTVGSDGSAAKSLYDSVIEMLQKLARAFTKAGYIDGVKDLQKVRRAATDAFIEWSAATENANNLPKEQAQMLRQFEKAGGVQQQAPAKGQPRFQRNKFPSTLPDNSPLLVPTIKDNSEERIALRRALINKHFDGLQPVEGKPVLLTLGGGGGVGKTTVLNRAATLGGFSVKDMQMVAVNADDIKEMIPEYGQIKAAGDWRAAATVHDESSLIAKAVRFRALGMTAKDAPEDVRAYMPEKQAGKYNLLMDATMSKPSTGIPLIQQAAERGYITTMMAVVADPATAVERAVARGEKSGRFVPEEVLAEAHLGFLQSLDKYASVVNSFRLWDNNGIEAKEVSLNEHRATVQQYIDSARRLAAANGKADGGLRQGEQQRGQLSRDDQAAGTGRAEQGQGQSGDGLAGGLSKFSRVTVYEAIAGKRTGPLAVYDAPPERLRSYLPGKLPITIDDNVIRKLASGKKGEREKMTAEQILQLTKLLENPAAVFRSSTRDDSIVVLTDMVIGGLPVVVPIMKTATNTYTVEMHRMFKEVNITSSVITSGYPKDAIGLLTWLANGQMVQWNKSLTGKAGFPVEMHGWMVSAARNLGQPSPVLKELLKKKRGQADAAEIKSAVTLDRGNALIAPTAQQQQPTAQIVPPPQRTGKTLTLKKPESKLQRKGLESAGDFSVKTMKDGSIEVYGDQQAIRSQLPEGVVGRVFAGGLKFTTSDAPRVKAALSGESLAYSRQGKVYDKLPMNNKGEYVGAPAKFNKPGNIFKLRKMLKDLTLEGAPGRFWYERSSEEVLRMTGGNVQEARKFVALLSIYSPQAKVDANSTFAVRAWAQHKAGQPIKVKTEVQDNKATEALQDVDKFWSGEKTGNFYNNLLRMIDPSSGDKQGATIDMWMMRAGQYSNDKPTDTQYAFMENETNRIAQELGWEPQQVQAAIWVAMKARMENDGVKKRTEAISEKRGWIKYVPGKDGKGKKRVILDEQKHRDNWLRESFALDVSAEDTAAAKFDFADGVLRHIGQVSWEPRPSTKLPILPGIHKAPYSQQLEFYQAVQQALYDENGADMLAQKLGLLVDGETQAPGIWESEVSAGGQKRIAMAPAAGKDGVKGIDPAQKQLLDAYSATLGLLLRQDGVGYHRPFYKSNKGDQNGVELRIGRPFTPEEAKQLWTAINTLMYDQGYTQWEQHVGLVSSPEGMRVIKFWGLMDNNAFRAAVDKSIESLPFDINESTDFAADGNLVDNNWQENPNGQNYQEVISRAGRSDLLGWSRDVLAPRVQAVFEEYAAKYNWGDPGQIRFSRTFAGPAELAGRPDTGRGTGKGQAVAGAIHYGRQGQLTNLSGASFGTGIKGAEQERLKTAADPRIKKRVYFYLPVAGGIAEPEIGLGAHVYSADLSGLYDSTVDPAIKGNGNELESAILDAGYRGYINREQGTAVVLNESVPVRYMGTAEQFNKVRRVIQRIAPKVQTRTEGNEVVRKAEPFVSMDARAKVQEAAPSFKMQYGEYRVKADEKDAANAALEAEGQQFRFQRNATKLMTVQEVLDFSKTGNLNLDLGENLRRMQIADAVMQAKDKNQVKKLMSDIGDTMIRLFADSLLPVQRWIESLPLSDLMKQRLAGDMRRADTVRMALEKEVKTKFAESMYVAVDKAAKKTGMSADQIKKLAGTWMTAKYAPKANRHLIAKDRAALLAAQQSGDATAIAKATADLQARLADVRGAVGATGFTRGVAGGFNDATAAQVVAGIEAKVDSQLLAEIAQPIYDMLKWKKQQDLASGRVTQQMINSWPNHADYVPLTGDPRATADYNDVFLTGNQLNQDADKAMNGRKDSVADDGIDSAFTAVVKSVNFAAFQDFKRTLNDTYLAAQKNGIDIGLSREPITGIQRPGDAVIMYRDNVANANGTTSQRSYAFRFDNPEIMAAMQKANTEITNGILTFFQTPTRWYGRLVTQFMPAFAPINFVRDVWERSELLRTRDVFDAKGNKVDVKKVARGSLAQLLNPELWQGSFQHNFNSKKRNAFRAELEEFIKLGGSSTWGDYLARASADLEADIRSETGLTPAARRKVMDKIEAYNNLFEMTYPLAIFKAFKEQGVTPKDAAAATLDLMNFRKKGTVMPGIRALYVFAQPAATSGYNLARYLSTPTGKKRFLAQVAIGTALYAFLAGLWGDEDDEELGNQLDNLSNFTVERSIPVKFGDMVIKIPVGFGAPQMAWAYAGIVNRIMSGRYEPAEGIAEGAKAWIKAVSPVAPSDIEISERPLQWMMQSLTPTVFKPIINIAADQTGLGLPLTPQFKDPTKMNYEQARRNTPTFFKELAKEVYEFSGIDLYPDHIKAITDGYAIGPMREITSYFIDNPSKALRGEPGRIPVLASIVDNINDRAILNAIYYRERDDLSDVAKEYNRRMENGTLAEWITPEKAQKAMMYKQFEQQERQFGRMRGNLDRMKLPEELYAIQRQAIETQADAARRQLLRVALQ